MESKSTSKNAKRGKVFLVGAGPGDLGLVTLRAKECIEQADVIIYDHLANPEMLGWAREDAEMIYAGKKAGEHALGQDKINALILEKAREGRRVIRLKGGDPFVFGRGAEEAEDLVQETLLAVHLKRHTYDPEALFTPWLYAIARYKLIDHLRSNKMSRMDVPIDDHQELMAADDHASTEGTHDMARLLGRLPLKTRQAIEAP